MGCVLVLAQTTNIRTNRLLGKSLVRVVRACIRQRAEEQNRPCKHLHLELDQNNADYLTDNYHDTACGELADGQFMAFTSSSSNLTRDPSSTPFQIFPRDTVGNGTSLVSTDNRSSPVSIDGLSAEPAVGGNLWPNRH